MLMQRVVMVIHVTLAHKIQPKNITVVQYTHDASRIVWAMARKKVREELKMSITIVPSNKVNPSLTNKDNSPFRHNVPENVEQHTTEWKAASNPIYTEHEKRANALGETESERKQKYTAGLSSWEATSRFRPWTEQTCNIELTWITWKLKELKNLLSTYIN